MQQALREADSLDPDDITEAIKTAYDPDFQCIHYDIWIHKLLVSQVTVMRFKIVNGDILNFHLNIHRPINHKILRNTIMIRVKYNILTNLTGSG